MPSALRKQQTRVRSSYHPNAHVRRVILHMRRRLTARHDAPPSTARNSSNIDLPPVFRELASGHELHSLCHKGCGHVDSVQRAAAAASRVDSYFGNFLGQQPEEPSISHPKGVPFFKDLHRDGNALLLRRSKRHPPLHRFSNSPILWLLIGVELVTQIIRHVWKSSEIKRWRPFPTLFLRPRKKKSGGVDNHGFAVGDALALDAKNRKEGLSASALLPEAPCSSSSSRFFFSLCHFGSFSIFFSPLLSLLVFFFSAPSSPSSLGERGDRTRVPVSLRLSVCAASVFCALRWSCPVLTYYVCISMSL